MFGGIGARGGKKDRKQILKNEKRKRKERIKAEEEKLVQEEKKKEKEEKGKILIQEKEKEEKQEENQKEKSTPSPRKHLFGGKEPFEEKSRKEPEKNKEIPPILPYPLPIPKKRKEQEPEKQQRKEQEIEKKQKKEKESKEQERQLPKIEKEEPPILTVEEKEVFQSKPFPFKEEETIKKESDEEDTENALEYKVVNELERLLKNCNYELKKIYVELNVLQKESENMETIREVEDALEEIERLLTYLEQIKKQLEVISDSYNLDLIHRLHDRTFTDLVEEYKSQVKSERQIENTVSNIKRNEEYTSLMKRILVFEQMQQTLREEIERKKEEIELREEEFEKGKEAFLPIEAMKEQIDRYIKESERRLVTMTQKVQEAVRQTTKTEIRLHYSMEAIARSLLLLHMIRKNPLRNANGMAAIQTLITLNLLKQILIPEKQKIQLTEYHYTDYQDMIHQSLNDTKEINQIIESGFTQIKDLRTYIEKEFGAYKDSLPEYKDLLASMDKIEKELSERAQNMKNIQSEMERNLESNNQKVLYYKQLDGQEEVIE